MWFAPFFSNPWLQDIVAMVLTFVGALSFLRLIDALALRGVLEKKLSRKIIHIGTGPIFLLFWNLFSAQPAARWFAAMVPLAITAQFVMVGTGIMKDDAAVEAMTRTGDRREILRGPLFYGIVFVVCTVVFWLDSAVGVVALMLMCGGDGLADVVGRRFGKTKLPWSKDKSWAGSAAMFLGGFVFALAFVTFFSVMGSFPTTLNPGSAAVSIAIIALVATAVEAIPIRDIDNITITLTAIVLGMLLL